MTKKYIEGFYNSQTGTLLDRNNTIIDDLKTKYKNNRNKYTKEILEYTETNIPDNTNYNEWSKIYGDLNNAESSIQGNLSTIDEYKKRIDKQISESNTSIDEQNKELEDNRIKSNRLQNERQKIEKDIYTFHKIISNGRQKLLFGRNISIILIIINIFLLVYLFYSIKNIN